MKETGGNKSCKVHWPDIDIINGNKLQFLYTFTFGFLIPFAMIMTFYFLILCKLRHLYSAKGRSRRRRVTFLVLTLITVYFICWIPYWIGHIIFAFFEEDKMTKPIVIFTLISAWLSFANSAINPALYAFTNKNFNDSFMKLITCGRKQEEPMSTLHTGGLSYYGSAKTEPSHSFVFQSTFDGINYPATREQ
ncbi:Somatostatin receptor type 1-like protein [Leptotrombidium deliense]|uniref:Somatostatin receptor type 1-like protein n=1 Tax=Leptotrombidium deliense TaxID=299467 RepID=A0A443SRN0_9ACAR|nr:Somatostatin receptor type 1-like protein [Leptotrombidium deliense]